MISLNESGEFEFVIVKESWSLHEVAENTMMMNTIEVVARQLLKAAKQCHQEHGRLTDQMLSMLDCIFQGILLHALDLIDRHSVSLILSPSGRCLYQVHGRSGVNYLCLRATNYCTCPAYHYSVIRRGEHIMCKHLLACRLSEALGCYKEIQYSDETIALMLVEME